MSTVKILTDEQVKQVMFKSALDGRLAVVSSITDKGIVLEMENIKQPRFFDRQTIEKGWWMISDHRTMVTEMYKVKHVKRGILPRLMTDENCYEAAEYIYASLQGSFEISMVEVYGYLIELRDAFAAIK